VLATLGAFVGTSFTAAVGALDRQILAADAIGKTACGVLRFPGT
jgi:hypothetical protein